MPSFLLKSLYFFFHNPIFKAIRVLQFLLAIVIFFLFALMPAGDTPPTIPPAILHFTGNLLLISSAWVALAESLTLKKILILTFILSICSELAQSFTVSRVTDIIDFCINFIGLFFGAWLCSIGSRILKAKDVIASV